MSIGGSGSIHISQEESVPDTDAIDNLIEEVVNLARQINLEVDSDDIQELLDTHNQELTMDELIEVSDERKSIICSSGKIGVYWAYSKVYGCTAFGS
ncbi:hypothetical protein TNCV_2489581 [Trichonephila clavipes]|nr:hypothetical protein TNCV_2489581 [Trichonephila clavipes]